MPEGFDIRLLLGMAVPLLYGAVWIAERYREAQERSQKRRESDEQERGPYRPPPLDRGDQSQRQQPPRPPRQEPPRPPRPTMPTPPRPGRTEPPRPPRTRSPQPPTAPTPPRPTRARPAEPRRPAPQPQPAARAERQQRQVQRGQLSEAERQERIRRAFEKKQQRDQAGKQDATYEVERQAAIDEAVYDFDAVYGTPTAVGRRVARPRPAVARKIDKVLLSPSGFEAAFLMNEILGKPLATRENHLEDRPA